MAVAMGVANQSILSLTRFHLVGSFRLTLSTVNRISMMKRMQGMKESCLAEIYPRVMMQTVALVATVAAARCWTGIAATRGQWRCEL